jgi:hypothetical protein
MTGELDGGEASPRRLMEVEHSGQKRGGPRRSAKGLVRVEVLEGHAKTSLRPEQILEARVPQAARLDLYEHYMHASQDELIAAMKLAGEHWRAS